MKVLNCVKFGESEIQQKNVLLSVKITFQDTYSEGLIISFASDKLQESIKNTAVLKSLSTHHSPISFTLRRSEIIAKGKGLWIFKSSLTLNKELVEKIKEHISTCLNLLEKENIVDDQVRWEYLKYEIRKFSIKLAKAQAMKRRLERALLEKKLKKLGK